MASVGEGIALQVIVLGSGGGPQENNITAFLVRSVAARWGRGSVLAVDAGVHLAAITRILERSNRRLFEEVADDPAAAAAREAEKRGRCDARVAREPFAGLELPRRSATGNANYITNVLVETYLITHPHLDHISGLVINTAGLTGTRPKRIAGLPATIEALKTHIFNDVIWPNLSDENNGPGIINYMRLVEGGPPPVEAADAAESEGFVKICEGLQVKAWSISHGHCAERHDSHETRLSPPPPLPPPGTSVAQLPLRSHPSHSRRPPGGERVSLRPRTPKELGVYDSCAFFIRDTATATEVLIFGDVEPDSISLLPRNRRIWAEAAPKIFAGRLRGIFIECSYDDTRPAESLFGHLAPRYLIEEIKVLAAEVRKLRCQEQQQRKRKRTINGCAECLRRKPPLPSAAESCAADSDLSRPPTDDDADDADDDEVSDHPSIEATALATRDELPLKGVKVVVIHIKERLDDDVNVAETIHRQLLEHERLARLGCEFIISNAGQSLYF